jgi:hypothetical protein
MMMTFHRVRPLAYPSAQMIAQWIFTASVFMYKTVIDKIVDNREATIEAFKEEQFNVIWTSLETLQLQAEKDVTEISQNIEEDILSLSPEELAILEYDMTNDVFNDNLHQILNSNIKNHCLNGIKNHMNSIVVMTTDGYMEDSNYYRATESNNNYIRSWQTITDNSYNTKLENDAIDKLLNRNSGVIATESYNLLKDDNHILIDELTYDSLLKVFLQEGVTGLKNYQIFVPYYITDFGDIFGNPDIEHGIKLDNNKLIVVQEFNLYDQIMNRHNELFNDNQIRQVMTRYNEVLRLMYIFGISLITSVTGLILYLCSVYNALLIKEENEENESEDSLIDDETQDDQE